MQHVTIQLTNSLIEYVEDLNTAVRVLNNDRDVIAKINSRVIKINRYFDKTINKLLLPTIQCTDNRYYLNPISMKDIYALEGSLLSSIANEFVGEMVTTKTIQTMETYINNREKYGVVKVSDDCNGRSRDFVIRFDMDKVGL